MSIAGRNASTGTCFATLETTEEAPFAFLYTGEVTVPQSLSNDGRGPSLALIQSMSCRGPSFAAGILPEAEDGAAVISDWVGSAVRDV